MTSKNLGYTDTPIIPGTNYHVHDGNRPQPPVVRPGEQVGQPPSDAVILFDGTSTSAWVGRDGGPAKWTVQDGYMQAAPGAGDIRTRESFGSCQLHLEWAAPATVKGESQGRGNSGVFLLGLYEIQVLDCYDNPTYPDGTTAAIYGQYPPLVNACHKPGEWQTYDIIWESPHWEGDKLVSPAYVTVLFNGVLVHHHTSPQGPTGHRTLSSYNRHPETGPLSLQDHGDPVRFRNIWIRPLKGYDQG
jgi:hypothetical protein